MRIVVFVGSPISSEEGDLVKLAKKLKKEKVNVDIVSFGDHSGNNELLTAFVNTLNGKDGTGSHLISVPRGSVLSEALISSPIIQGEDGQGAANLGGAGFEFGFDPNEDPELALVCIHINKKKIKSNSIFNTVFIFQKSGIACFDGGTTSTPRRRTTSGISRIRSKRCNCCYIGWWYDRIGIG